MSPAALPSRPRRAILLGAATALLPAVPVAAQRVPPANRVTVQAVNDLTVAIYNHARRYDGFGGGVGRIEDGLGACAALLGEACLVVGAQFDLATGHFGNRVIRVTTKAIDPGPDKIAIGQPVFAERINSFLVQLNTSLKYVLPFPPADFPDVTAVFRHIAAALPSAEPGWVPLTVPEANRPRRMPLKEAYELRPKLHEILHRIGASELGDERINLCTSTLAQTFRMAVNFEARIMLLLVYETIFGMAKMVPAIGPQWRRPGTVLGPA